MISPPDPKEAARRQRCRGFDLATVLGLFLAGVSIRLIFFLFHSTGAMADVMVILRAISSSS